MDFQLHSLQHNDVQELIKKRNLMRLRHITMTTSIVLTSVQAGSQAASGKADSHGNK